MYVCILICLYIYVCIYNISTKTKQRHRRPRADQDACDCRLGIEPRSHEPECKGSFKGFYKGLHKGSRFPLKGSIMQRSQHIRIQFWVHHTITISEIGNYL